MSKWFVSLSRQLLNKIFDSFKWLLPSPFVLYLNQDPLSIQSRPQYLNQCIILQRISTILSIFNNFVEIIYRYCVLGNAHTLGPVLYVAFPSNLIRRIL